MVTIFSAGAKGWLEPLTNKTVLEHAASCREPLGHYARTHRTGEKHFRAGNFIVDFEVDLMFPLSVYCRDAAIVERN